MHVVSEIPGGPDDLRTLHRNKPISAGDIWRLARLIVAQRGQRGAVDFAWQRVRELTALRDRTGVETWCWILEAIEGLLMGSAEDQA